MIQQQESYNTYGCGHQNGSLADAELVQRVLPLPLRTVAMDTRGRVVLVVEEVLEGVSALLRLHKHKGERVGT